MRRSVYLIRHAMPDIPLGERWCVGGLTDLPLSELGRLQCALLPFVPALQGVTAVFCSPMLRAIETARPLCARPRVIEGLQEQVMGVWDGLSFAEIREKFPALYAAREEDPTLLPEGAEPLEAVRARMLAALRRCLDESEGDIAVVSHRTAISTLTGHRELLGHTTISALQFDGDDYSVKEIGLRPDPPLNDKVCLALLRASGSDRDRIDHCRAVAKLSDTLCRALRDKGIPLEAKAVHRAALLHDIAKGRAEHAALGGVWLRELGHPKLADVVRQHTEPDGTGLNEATLVFYADKLLRGDKRCTLDERFAASLEKCKTPEALAAHARRRAAAEAVQAQIILLCGEEILKQEGIL